MYLRDLSKSKLISYRQCPKRLWLEIHNPELRQDSAASKSVFRTGHQVGDLARRIFDPDGTGTFVDLNADGYREAISKTSKHLFDGKPIFEAGFSAGGAMAFSDVLLPTKKNGKTTWKMIEVKASTSVKPYYEDDVAIQAFVARSSGVELTAVSLAHIDSSWVYPGNSDYRGLLVEADLTERAFSRSEEVKSWIADAQNVAACGDPPKISIGQHCNQPFPCGFFDHCNKGNVTPEMPVSWLPRIQSKALKDYIESHAVTDMREIPRSMLNDRQQRVLDHTVKNEIYFDAEGAAQDLSTYPFPARFLDFETIQFGVPIWVGSRPFQSIPYQFSLHTIDTEGQLSHSEFLDLSGNDPRPSFAAALVQSCGSPGPIFVYNAGFEGSRIRELATLFPHLETQLLKIKDQLVDLLPIAANRFYHPTQEGSWSIKKVLPAIAPEFEYSQLEGIQDGNSSMDAFLESLDKNTTANRLSEIREQMLKYCELDTFAMVRIWEKFRGVVNTQYSNGRGNK